MNRVLEGREDRAAEVVRLYFGMEEEEAMTLSEIGARFHVRVRQIKEEALVKLRHPRRRVQLEAMMMPK